MFRACLLCSILFFPAILSERTCPSRVMEKIPRFSSTPLTTEVNAIAEGGIVVVKVPVQPVFLNLAKLEVPPLLQRI